MMLWRGWMPPTPGIIQRGGGETSIENTRINDTEKAEEAKHGCFGLSRMNYFSVAEICRWLGQQMMNSAGLQNTLAGVASFSMAHSASGAGKMKCVLPHSGLEPSESLFKCSVHKAEEREGGVPCVKPGVRMSIS